MKTKWAPTCYINTDTGEIFERDFKEKYYFKVMSEWDEAEYRNSERIIHTFKLIKVNGKREKQLELF